MDPVSVEIAAIRSALAEATEKIEALNGLVVSSENDETDTPDPAVEDITAAELIHRAERLLKWSRLKADTLNLGSGLFADSCWNMCLDTYICDLKGQKITVSSIAHSSGIPMTTAMRYINVMAEEGLLEKSPNPSDNRMIFISTSETCKDKISTILSHFK
ncbi:helix-turn-helix domain-containing protein [Sphingorhabdus sp. EL138]|uniref:helix-turn-helix domain-containing protein n=1 Tax=Sphingorhabdus sp. EL138 TaxID=2073156 RepID=UPI000D69DFA4|nr:helix-turn-helix domain-containing protein [Sphingorhabdus sp. EL138]